MGVKRETTYIYDSEGRKADLNLKVKTPKWIEQLIELKAYGKKDSEIAKIVGKHRAHIRKIISLPTVKKCIDEKISSIREFYEIKVFNLIESSIDTLKNILTSSKDDKVRLEAVKMILEKHNLAGGNSKSGSNENATQILINFMNSDDGKKDQCSWQIPTPDTEEK